MKRVVWMVLACLLLCGIGAAYEGEPPGPGGETPPIQGEAAEDGFDIVMTFTGDMLLASYKNELAAGNFRDYAAKNEASYFLQNVKPIFDADDLTLVNLETVLSDRWLPERDKGEGVAYWFRGPAANTGILTCSGVEAVSIANNHTGDYGPGGFQDTIQAVEDAGLLYGSNDKTLYFEKNGYRVAIVCHGLWNEQQANDIIRRIEAAQADSDYQIVFFHGGKEGVHTPEDWKQRACRKLADAGADLVIGAHPHVLQPREVYNGVEILYSLGNFCYGGSRYPENRTAIYQMALHISAGGVLESAASQVIPCYVYTDTANNYCPAPIADEAEKQRVLDFVDGRLESPL